MATSEDTKITVRLLIDKEKNQVAFAEADNYFVDTLLSFLTLPMGTIVRLLSKQSGGEPTAIESLSNLYKSISNLDIKYFGSEKCKDMLLNPKNSSEDMCRKLKFNIDDTEPIKYFICENYYCVRSDKAILSTYDGEKCTCGKPVYLDVSLKYPDVNSPRTKDGVFVTELTSFAIREDLHIFPILASLTYPLLDDIGTKDFEEKTLDIDCNVMLKLLKYSLLSKTPLSDIFLGNEHIVTNMVSKPSHYSPLPQMEKEATDDSIKMAIKIFVRKSSSKVLFAEAQNDFINFLFSFVTIPMGSVMHLLRGDTSISSMDNFYKSVSNWNTSSPLKSQEVKDRLVCPLLYPNYLCSNQILPLKESSTQFYCTISSVDIYGQYSGYLTLTEGDNYPVTLKDPKDNGGFVRGAVAFMVTDDLVVTPLSYISGIQFLNRTKIPRSEIEEQVINIGIEEALSILRASISSSEALTVGLSHILKKPKLEESCLKVPKQEK